MIQAPQKPLSDEDSPSTSSTTVNRTSSSDTPPPTEVNGVLNTDNLQGNDGGSRVRGPMVSDSRRAQLLAMKERRQQAARNGSKNPVATTSQPLPKIPAKLPTFESGRSSSSSTSSLVREKELREKELLAQQESIANAEMPKEVLQLTEHNLSRFARDEDVASKMRRGQPSVDVESRQPGDLRHPDNKSVKSKASKGFMI
jgi:hypothetical protein